jgi:hypothetical protein
MAYFTDPMGSEFRKALDDVLKQIELKEKKNGSKSTRKRTKTLAKPGRPAKRRSVRANYQNNKKRMNRLSAKTRKELR